MAIEDILREIVDELKSLRAYERDQLQELKKITEMQHRLSQKLDCVSHNTLCLVDLIDTHVILTACTHPHPLVQYEGYRNLPHAFKGVDFTTDESRESLEKEGFTIVNEHNPRNGMTYHVIRRMTSDVLKNKDLKAEYSSKELSEVLGLSVRGLHLRATREQWSYRTVPNPSGGGVMNLYAFATLPNAVREKVSSASESGHED